MHCTQVGFKIHFSRKFLRALLVWVFFRKRWIDLLFLLQRLLDISEWKKSLWSTTILLPHEHQPSNSSAGNTRSPPILNPATQQSHPSPTFRPCCRNYMTSLVDCTEEPAKWPIIVRICLRVPIACTKFWTQFLQGFTLGQFGQWINRLRKKETDTVFFFLSLSSFPATKTTISYITINWWKHQFGWSAYYQTKSQIKLFSGSLTRPKILSKFKNRYFVQSGAASIFQSFCFCCACLVCSAEFLISMPPPLDTTWPHLSPHSR